MKTVIALFSLLTFATSNVARGDTFGSGANTFNIEFVTIGNPGNPGDFTGDPTYVGSVPYLYRIGKHEISELMITKANALGGLSITHDTRGPDKPATNVTWYEAARFVNWLNTSKGRSPAYKFDRSGAHQLWQPTDAGFNESNPFRNSLAMYFLPSVDEWFKAAYYEPTRGVYFNYPNGSNSPPFAVISGTTSRTAVYNQDPPFAGPADITQAGGLSPYGTMAQGGNVYEWEETWDHPMYQTALEARGRRGGSWESGFRGLDSSSHIGGLPTYSFSDTGFRIASIVPEPSAALVAASIFALLASRRPRS